MQQKECEPGTPLPFEGADNFRELGGYPVRDGRRVRHGIFWRSGAPAKLMSEHDRQLFESLGIRTIFDFRSAAERAYLPDPVFPGVTLYEISAILDENGNEVNFDPRELAAQGHDAARRYLEQGIPRIYQKLPFANPAYRKLFACLLAGEVPVLFHCTAGKDRTGMAAALILLALGADRETIRQDYLLTNRWRADTIRAAQAAQPERADDLALLMGVRMEDLDTALDAIDRAYPNLEAYLQAELGLDAAALQTLRTMYLE